MKKVIGVFLALTGIIIAAIGFLIKTRGQMSMVIGGADGPTSIFLAGKIGKGSMIAEIVTGIVLLAAGILMILRKK